MIKLLPKRPKKYLRGGVGVEQFFSTLNDLGIRYVLLRWWRDYSLIERGEDLDILVHADDYPRIEVFLTSNAGGQRCDVYVDRGTGGSRPAKLPYFPPRLAEDILQHRTSHMGRVFVPSPPHYFASLAFHALFHKGATSGIPGFAEGVPQLQKVDHDYVGELSLAAVAAGLDVPLTADSIFSWLEQNEYAPPLDMLGKLADKRSELIRFARLPDVEQWRREGELLVFVVRKAGATDTEYISRLEILLQEDRIEIIGQHRLSDHEVERCSTLRGANWSRGPFPRSAGRPHTFLVCYDWYPKLLTDRSRHSLLLNENLLKLKEQSRRLYNARRLPWNRANPVHTPDNEPEALQYLATANDGLAEKYKAESERRKARFRPDRPIVRTLSEGRRSRTDLVRYGNGLAIQKTFKTAFDGCFENEMLARKQFAGSVPMPRILDASDGRIVTEYLDGRRYFSPDEMSRQEKHLAARTLVSWIRAFWEEGFFNADFSPRNILVDDKGDLSMIDFEFLQSYRGVRPQFDKAYEFDGITDSSRYDLPVTRSPKCIRHHANWKSMPFGTYFGPLLAEENFRPISTSAFAAE